VAKRICGGKNRWKTLKKCDKNDMGCTLAYAVPKVWLFPDPVGPYAIIVTLKPAMSCSSNGIADLLNISVCWLL